jgi:hypothetical protein
MKKTLLSVLMTLLITSGLVYSQELNKQNAAPAASSKDKEVTKDKTLAIVNNEAIMQSDYDRLSEPMIENYRRNKPNMTEEQIQKLRQSMLDEMVNNKLIIQEAKKQKITVSQRQLDEQLKKIKDQFGSEATFKAELRKANLTPEKLTDQIKEQLMVEELSYREVNSKVSEPTADDTTKLIDMLKKKLNGETIETLTDQENEELDQLANLVKKYLSNKKAQEVYNAWMKDLRSKSNIKVNPLD